MLGNERLVRTLVILGIICALVYLGRLLWEIGSTLSDLILLLALAWLVAYVLHPIASWLNQAKIPDSVVERSRHRLGDRGATLLANFRVPYSLAAVSIYLTVLCILMLVTILAVPGLIKQLGQLANQVPNYIQHLPDWWDGIQGRIVDRFNVDPETLAKAVPIERFTQEATAALPQVIGNVVTVVQRIASGVASLSLMLIMSLYMMLDSKRLTDQFYRLVPLQYEDDFQFIFKTINRTFGGFLRGQVLMAVIMGIFAAVVMRLFGLQYTMVTSILAGLVMFVPEVGAPVAMFAPSIASILQGSDATVPLLIIVLVFQQVLLRLIMPKILSEVIGMPPLLVLLSLLVGAKVLGIWGFFFGVPVAGAIYTITIVTLERTKASLDHVHNQQTMEEQIQQVLDDK
jgi:predicted PurR-regulated permease PerM